MLIWFRVRLSLEDMEKASWVIPWQHTGALASSFHEQKAELQQRIMRCDEEMHIVVREREDMVLYYKQLVTSLQSALEERRLGNTCLPSDPACHILQRHSPFDCANFKQHYIQLGGEMHMLSAKLLRNEHLLSQASKLSDKLQHALESKSELQASDAIEPDELLLHDQVTQELDQALMLPILVIC